MRLSREVESLIAYVARSGLPHRVTSTTGGAHSSKSRHYKPGTDGQGLAVDFAGPVPNDKPAMLKIYQLLLPLGPHLHELIFSHEDADILIRDGKRVVPAVYAAVLPAHRNHVHVSVDLGTFVEWPKETTMPDSELPKASAPVVGLVPTSTDKGYWIVCADGAVYAFGDAVYHGRVLAPAE